MGFGLPRQRAGHHPAPSSPDECSCPPPAILKSRRSTSPAPSSPSSASAPSSTGSSKDPSTAGRARAACSSSASPLMALSLFIRRELRTPNPMLNLRYFSDRRFSVASGGMTLIFFAMFGTFFLVSQYFQLVLGYTALQSGLFQLPMAFVMMALSPQVPKLVSRFGVATPRPGGAEPRRGRPDAVLLPRRRHRHLVGLWADPLPRHRDGPDHDADDDLDHGGGARHQGRRGLRDERHDARARRCARRRGPRIAGDLDLLRVAGRRPRRPQRRRAGGRRLRPGRRVQRRPGLGRARCVARGRRQPGLRRRPRGGGGHRSGRRRAGRGGGLAAAPREDAGDEMEPTRSGLERPTRSSPSPTERPGARC